MTGARYWTSVQSITPAVLPKLGPDDRAQPAPVPREVAMRVCARAVIAAALVLAAALPQAARAQDDKQQWARYIQGHCGKELKQLCTGVRQGEGRILACLYAREDKLSARCGNAVMGSLERLGAALGALANVQRVCESDARRLCNGVMAGNGNLIGCLSQARASVSAQCNAMLDTAFLRP
jgi:hypothetical protein